MEDAISLIRAFLADVRPREMSGKVFGYGPFPTRIMDLGGLPVEEALLQARRAASKGEWECCVLSFEASVGEPPKLGDPDTRREVISFIGEARRLKPVVMNFALDRLPDGSIRLGRLVHIGNVADVIDPPGLDHGGRN